MISEMCYTISCHMKTEVKKKAFAEEILSNSSLKTKK
jgi:hypothetical protein